MPGGLIVRIWGAGERLRIISGVKKMIRIEHVTREYGGFKAVDDVSISIEPGEIVGLLGHNGAGKTTIMKMLTGFVEPTGGTITINGKDIGADRPAVQEEIGYLPENCPVYLEMTVVEYLDYMASLHGLPEEKRAPLITAAIVRTGLQDKAFQSISTLSRGYRQRTGVAQAILHEPDILILDEPTNGLDPTQILQMRGLITELAKSSTVIVSTHVLQEVQAICDRVIILKNGRKALDARLDDLQTEGRLLLQVGGKDDDPRPLIKSCPGVDAVLPAGNFPPFKSGWSCAVTMAAAEDRQEAAARISHALHENGYRLYGMRFESRNLETVFAEISA
jgi:ABC-2 type transport system ATP-binding protein